MIEKGMRIREITENNGLLLETMKQLQNQNVEVSPAADHGKQEETNCTNTS